MNEHESKIDELLIDWEVARGEGKEISAKDLCSDSPELLELVEQRIGVLKALSWAGEPDELIEGIEDDVAAHASSNELPDSDLSIYEFVQELSNSGVVQQKTIDTIRATSAKESAKELALRLIDEGTLTPYQARVILERGDSPLLLDRYIILDSLGAGGMGIVFKALHKSLERVVAIKVLPKHAVDSPEKVERFQREMRAAAKVSHPNLVQAYDAHESNGVFFFAMEYVTGSDLAEWVKQHGPMDAEQAVSVIAQAAGGLSSAHKSGLIHRDVKPSNILLSESGTTKVLDLGLAKSISLVQTSTVNDLTREGIAMGTVAYMSPEQAFDAQRADEQSDIYSLGATLYFLLHGKPIFDFPNSVQMIVAHRERPAPKLGEGRTDVSEGLESIYQSMVAKSPADRPGSMEEIQRNLSDLVNRSSSAVAGMQQSRSTLPRIQTAKADNPVGGKQKQFGHRVIILAVAALCLLVGGGLYSFGLVDAILGSKAQGAESTRELAVQLLTDGMASLEIVGIDGQYYVDFPEDLPPDEFQITGITLYSDQQSQLERFASLPDLKHLDIMSADAENMQQANLDGINLLQSLEDFGIDGCVVSDVDLDAIAALTSLNKLSLDACELPSDLTPLSKRSFTELSFMQSDVRNESLAWLANQNRLEYLDLSNTYATTAIVADLKPLNQLQVLNLTGLELTKELKDVSDLNSLGQLLLDGTDLQDEFVESIVALENLHTLDVSYTRLTASGVDKLASMQTLNDLSLQALPVNQSMKKLAALPNLEVLDLRDTDLDDSGLDDLSRQRKLKMLFIDGTATSQQRVERLLKRIPMCEIGDPLLP